MKNGRNCGTLILVKPTLESGNQIVSMGENAVDERRVK